jgi:hypothetical protein
MAKDKEAPVRIVAARRWSSLTVAGAAVGLVVAGAAGQAAAGGDNAPGPEKLWLAQAEGGEGGEGGEAGALASSGDEAADLLNAFAQIEGHLSTAMALFAAGDSHGEHPHFGHPKAEIYEPIEHKLEEKGLPGFEAELEALAAAAAEGKPAAEVEAAHAAVLARIEAARATLAASPKSQLTAVMLLVRKAAEEYGEGVKDGTVAELHEYQDAWGFVQAAGAAVDRLAASEDAAVKEAAAKARAALDELAPALPGVVPEGKIAGDAGLLSAAAAKIELAAYGLK